MNSVIDILEELESNNSRLFKEEVLERNSKNDLLKKIFVLTLDPYTNYYVNKFKISFYSEQVEDDDIVIESFISLLTDGLSNRNLTGNAAKRAVERFFELLSEKQAKWCQRILLKNLRCGVHDATINKIWPGAVTKFSVQLAETLKSHFEKDKGIVIDDSIHYPVRVEPKLDGLRCIAVKHNGEVTMFTRNGTVLETLPTIKKAIEDSPWDNFVLDGEAMGLNWNESVSVVMSRKKNKDDKNMVYCVFDSMNFEDWKNQNNSTILSKRIEKTAELIAQVQSPCIIHVEGSNISSHEELMNFYSQCMSKGYEGIMVKSINSSYAFKRSNSVLKLKPVSTAELMIVGHYKGTRGSKREELWGGFEALGVNGIVTRVGGGFNDKIRAEIQTGGPDSYIGNIIECEYQPDPLTADGFTVDGKLRFPVFVRFRDNSDVDDNLIKAGVEFLKKIKTQVQ